MSTASIASLPRQRRTRIVATLGPASTDPAMIAALFHAGADVFRLNFSHGVHADHQARLKTIRDLEKSVGHPIGIIADLQGPKLRVGKFANKAIDLKAGMVFSMDLDDTPGDESRVCLPHPEIISVAEKGMMLLVDDGKVQLAVREKHKNSLLVEVISGARLSDNKGVNVPGMILPIPALTDKDRVDLAAAMDMGADWIAQSFVQTPGDVLEARALMQGSSAALLVKIEKPSAVALLEDIVALADGVMIARGDLGVEIPPEDVPAVQKRAVRLVRQAGKPVIVATQMLESMITNPRPTRAEASDVATAVYDGADAVMLSAETAAGEYPLDAVEMMAKICRATEVDETYAQIRDSDHPDTIGGPPDAIATAAYYVAQDVEAAAIVTYTMSGATALRMARQRPLIPILCITPRLSVARQLATVYGVYPLHLPDADADLTAAAPQAARTLLDMGLAERGRRFVMTAGVPFGTPGSTNILRIADV